MNRFPTIGTGTGAVPIHPLKKSCNSESQTRTARPAGAVNFADHHAIAKSRQGGGGGLRVRLPLAAAEVRVQFRQVYPKFYPRRLFVG
jgi:hypothetical protein